MTPEEISQYIAKICKDKIVLDGFGGCGGNTIQFSKFCKGVIYNDLDPKKVEFCKRNTNTYNCKENIQYLNFDFLELKDKIKVSS